MATTQEAIHTPTRTIRKRTSPPTKTRAELAQEFDALPLSALTGQPQVAAFLDCSEAKLERDRWAGGGIPYLKTGRNVRYKKADVLAYLEGKTRTSTTEGKA
jgi:hypothetical protein